MCSVRKAKADQDLVAPRRHSSRARPRHDAVHIRDALRVIERASTPGTEELPTRCNVECVLLYTMVNVDIFERDRDTQPREFMKSGSCHTYITSTSYDTYVD